MADDAVTTDRCKKVKAREMSSTRGTGLLLLLCATLARPAAAQTRDLSTLSLQELLNIDVTSVSRKEETLLRTAAAVYVITEDDIRKSGATTLPDVLRMVPGFAVAQQSANSWSVTARGFAGVKANKLLVLIDGRSLYAPLNGGVFWDMQWLPLESIARIEVIRGPGAAVWGTNAVNGVVNIITKTADQAQGGRVALHAGRYQPGAMDFRYGGKWGADGRHVTSGRVVQRRSPTTTGQPSSDDIEALFARTRLDWTAGESRLSVHGDLQRGSGETIEREVQLSAPFDTAVARHTNSAAGNVILAWSRGPVGSESNVQIYYSGYTRSDLGEEAHTIDLDGRRRFPIGRRHDVVVGAGVRSIADRMTPSSTTSISPSHMRRQFATAFGHDEVAIGRRLHVTGGAKAEQNPFTGFEIQPSVRALWAATERQSLWGAVSRTVRPPNRYERGMTIILSARPGPGVPAVVTLHGSDQTWSEILTAYEAGYRMSSQKFSVDTTAFVGSYADLTSQLATPARMADLQGVRVLQVPLVKRQDASATAGGAEIAAMWRPGARWDIAGSYSLYHIAYGVSRIGGSAQIVPINGPVPRHLVHARGSIDLARGLEASALFYRSSAIANTEIPSLNRLDLRVAWTRGGATLAAGVQNLLHAAVAEHVDRAARTVPSPVRVNPYAEVSWRF
jgi:iron complex outermembrane receptor protein